MDAEPTLLNPGSRSIHFVWSTSCAALVVGVCSLFGLLQWCGDGVESCANAAIATDLAVRALTWAACGGIIAGTIVAVAPWSERARTRIVSGIGVAVLVVVATGLYLLL
ncbi:hypothetical protein [Conyzicola sp.]|uniref:hypothetical protein n=1 Tax=Conyzicola sp. TaxID=1969404 RepID=UPI003989D432